MSTIRGGSAVFPNASGPHGSLPAPFNWAPVRWWPIQGLAGLGNAFTRLLRAAAPTASAWMPSWPTAPVPPNEPAGMLWGQAWRLSPGQVGRFTLVLASRFDPEKRGGIEAELERSGISTSGVAYGRSPTQLYWDVTPRDRVVSSNEIQAFLRAAFANAGIPLVVCYMPAPTRMADPIAPYQDAIAGLGAIPESLLRNFTNFTADMLCSPAIQATAADDIARRYGEAQAAQFREHLRQATAYCQPGAVVRVQEQAAAAERKRALWAAGFFAAGAAVLGAIWYVSKPKKNPRRRNSRWSRLTPKSYDLVTRSIHLQAIGRVHAKLAGNLQPGDVTLWNFGFPARVVSVEDTSPKMVTVILEDEKTGKQHERRMKKDRLVGVTRETALPLPDFTKNRGRRRRNSSKRVRFVAIDPKTGAHLRTATKTEARKYLAQPVRHGAFRKPLRVGRVLIDEYTGPGQWHIPGRFLKSNGRRRNASGWTQEESIGGHLVWVKYVDKDILVVYPERGHGFDWGISFGDPVLASAHGIRKSGNAATVTAAKDAAEQAYAKATRSRRRRRPYYRF